MKYSSEIITVDAVLFDLDGTLIDSSAAYERVWTRWAEHYNLAPDIVINESHGRRPEDTIRSVLGYRVDIQRAVGLFTAEEKKEHHFTAIPGAKHLMRALPKSKWAIVTSSTELIARIKLACCELPEPEILISAEKVNLGKPDPEGYKQAANQLKVDIIRCLVIEDAPSGIEAGHRSGADVLVVAATYNASNFVHEKVVNSLEDIRVVDISSDGCLMLMVNI